MVNKSVADDFLKSFFNLHEAIIRVKKYKGQIVDGQVFWLDDIDDTQTFRWYIEKPENDIKRMKLLCDFLHKKKLVDGDRIIISEPELMENLKIAGWDQNDIESAINALMSTEIKMVDEGEETDSFYIHF